MWNGFRWFSLRSTTGYGLASLRDRLGDELANIPPT
jgi:hypothetical protein